MNLNILQSMPSPKVSVIIPIYNTANYLREALDSICNQKTNRIRNHSYQ